VNLNTLKSWEFIGLVLTNVASWLNVVSGNTLNTHQAVLISALSAAAYALARGFAKLNTDGKPFYQTTEFYVAVCGALTAFIGGLKGDISPGLMAELLAAVSAASAIANGLRTPPAAR
jgi:hypothetical protein